jgi:hypothetical protein
MPSCHIASSRDGIIQAMDTSDRLLADIPDFISIESMLKATPHEAGGKRYVYLEASREARDQQDEIVLAKALEASADNYIKFGNLDLDHKSIPKVAKMYGIADPQLWEIGMPVDVRVSGKSTFVKAELYTGDTQLADKANMVWDSMTKLSPAKRWYPSVGGKVLAKSIHLDPATGDKIGVVSSVNWSNIALSATPVNQHVGGIATVPFGVLAKCWGSHGIDMAKALAASYATDAVGKTGGAALGMQSLDTGGAQEIPYSYHDFREKLAGCIKRKQAGKLNAKSLVQFCTNKFHLSLDEASEWVDRFLGDVKSSLTKRSTTP